MNRFACIILISVASIVAGCQTQADREFTAADVALIAAYIQRAQYATTVACQSLNKDGKASDATQLQTDMAAMAATEVKNMNARVAGSAGTDTLMTDANSAINLASDVIRFYQSLKTKGANNASTQPANQ